MADTSHRSSLTSAHASAAERSGWLWPVGVLLGLALAVAALVQWQQMRLLQPAMLVDDDAVVASTHRVEVAYLHLRERWPVSTSAQDAPPPGNESDSLPIRFAAFVSGVNLLRDEARKRLMQDEAVMTQAVQQASAFIQEADPVFAAAQGGALLDLSGLVALRPQLLTLAEQIHALSLWASQQVALHTTQREQSVRQHNVTSLALTVFLSVLMLTFAFIAFRQLRRLEQRRQSLEEISTWLRESQREAQSANLAKGAFLANMSHEIRTPFQGLLGMMTLLAESGLNPRQVELLDTATESADHLLQILNDILDMSQLETGRLRLLTSDVELRGLVRGVESLMRSQARRKELALHISIDPDVPHRLTLDATRVKQVLFNLLSNAIKFCDRGAVLLDIHCVNRSGVTAAHVPVSGHPAQSCELELVVTDSGIGMSAATLSRLFERFNQADDPPHRRHGGAGLGLQISRDLARLMGGDITVSSQLGVGSVFTFKLPAAVAYPLAGDDMDDSPLRSQIMGSLAILVAEDHDINRQFLAALLDGWGHRATFVANGQEAVHAVQHGSFDVVLMDLHMPVLDGAGAALAIRSLHDTSKATVPIVALTADAFSEARERCLSAGMNDFLTKPVAPLALGTSLRRLFGGTAVHLAPTGASATPWAISWASRTGPGLLDQGTINTALQAMPRERLVALMSSFMTELPSTVAMLHADVRDGRAQDLQAHAHAVRGAALNMGWAAVAHTAASLHQGALHLPAHEVALLVQRFDAQVHASAQALRAIDLLPPLAGQPSV